MRKHTTDRHWKEQVKDMLSLHAGERRGTLILLVLCFFASGWVACQAVTSPAVSGPVAWRRNSPAELAPYSATVASVTVKRSCSMSQKYTTTVVPTTPLHPYRTYSAGLPPHGRGRSGQWS